MGGGADATQFPAGQHRLEQVGSVHGTAGSGPGAHDGVDLVDEDHRIRDGPELFHDGLETALEFTAVAGAGQDQTHIEGVDLDVLELFGDLPLGDAQGQAFGQCGFAHTGIAHEQGIVLAATAQDLDGPVQFFLTSHQGVDPALTGTGGELGGVLFQNILPGFALFLPFGRIGGHPPGSAPFRHAVRDEGQRIQAIHSLTRQEVVGIAVLFIQDGHEQVAQLHLAPSRSVDMPQGPFEHPLHAGRLMDLVFSSTCISLRKKPSSCSRNTATLAPLPSSSRRPGATVVNENRMCSTVSNSCRRRCTSWTATFKTSWTAALSI